MDDQNGLRLVLAAADFAAFKHRGQLRKNGDVPYVNHAIAVARILSEEGGVEDAYTIAAALLHDTLEDTATAFDELKSQFGPLVAEIVAEVSDDKRLSKLERKRRQVEHACRLSKPARLVKLADKLHNLRDLALLPPPGWSLARVQGYFCWAYEVVAQIGPVNERLYATLQGVFGSCLDHRGHQVRAVPKDAGERAAMLATYYELMGRASD